MSSSVLTDWTWTLCEQEDVKQLPENRKAKWTRRPFSQTSSECGWLLDIQPGQFCYWMSTSNIVKTCCLQLYKESYSSSNIPSELKGCF